MPGRRALDLNPRKTPRQARATATVDAIFEATIQVLLREGLGQLTTTKVALRAGVSVGTMYQYYPHKQALLYAALERHLAMVADTVETACRAQTGRKLAEMADALVRAYIHAKTVRCDVSRALGMVAAQLDTVTLRAAALGRMETATAAMLASASDGRFEDLRTVTVTILATLSGAVRALFEWKSAAPLAMAVHSELAAMCRAYLLAARTAEVQRLRAGAS